MNHYGRTLNFGRTWIFCLLMIPMLLSLSAWTAPQREADIDRSGRVDHRDLLEFFTYWNAVAHQRSDLDGDDQMTESDLLTLLDSFHADVTPVPETDLQYGQALVGKVGGDYVSEYRFEGSAGDTFSIVIDALGAMNATAELISPASAVLEVFGTASTSNRDAVLDEYTIAADGVYKIRIYALSGGAVNYYGLGLSDRPLDTTTMLADGKTASGVLTPLADDDTFQFVGNASQVVRVIVQRDNTTLTTTLAATLYDPSGAELLESMTFSIPGGSGGDTGSAAFETTLPSNGTYTVLVDSELGPGGGGYTIAYYVQDRVEQAITTAIRQEGEIDRADVYDFTFSAIAGRYISAALDLLEREWNASLELIQLDGTEAETVLILRDRINDLRLDDRTGTLVTRIPATGDYLLRVRSNKTSGGANAGRFALYVSDFDAPPTPIQYGDVIEDEIYPSADDDVYTFTGSANDRMRIVGIRRDAGRVGGVDQELRAVLYDPDGAIVSMNVPGTRAANPSEKYNSENGGFLLESILSKNGVYTLVVDSQYIFGTAGYKFWIFQGEVTRQTVSPGEIIHASMGHLDIREYEFTAQPDDIISIQLDALEEQFTNTFTAAQLLQWDSDMTLIDLSDPFTPKTIFAITTKEDSIYEAVTRLPSAGPYVLRVMQGRGGDFTTTGDFILYLSDWAKTHTPVPIEPGEEIEGIIAPIADNDFYSFEVTSGEKIRILGRVQDPARDPQLRGTVYNAQGDLVTGITNPSKRLTGDTDGFELKFQADTTGQYLVKVDVDERTNFRTANYRIQMHKEKMTITPVQGGAIVPDYMAQGETKVYEFDAEADDFVSLWIDALGTPAGTRGLDSLGVLDLKVLVYDKNNILAGPITFPANTAGGRNDFRIENWRITAGSTYQVVVRQEATGNGMNAVGAFILYLSDFDKTPTPLVNNVYLSKVLDSFVDDDLYQFDATASDIVTIRAERPGAAQTSALRVTLWGPGRGGSILQTATTLTQPSNIADTGGAAIDNLAISQAGTYYVLVDEESPTSLSNNTTVGRGVYQLSLIRGGSPISVDEDAGGPVVVTPGTSMAGRIGFAGDTDEYELAITPEQAGRPISIFVQGHHRAAISENIKPQVVLLQGVTELVTGGVSGNNARIDDFILTTAATYTIRISAEIPTQGVYGLGISDLVSVQVASVTPGGYIASTIEQLGDEDEYIFSASAGDRMDISVRGSSMTGPTAFNSTLSLIDPAGGQLQVSSSAVNPSLLEVEAPSDGEYRARIEVDSHQAGNYLLEVNVASATPATTAIAFGEELGGQLMAQQDKALFTFDVTAETQNKNVSILCLGLSLDTFLQLQDPDGLIVVVGTENSKDAIIDDYPLSKVGTYTIIVSGNGSDLSGRFRIGLSDTPIETLALTPGSIISSVLNPLADEDAYVFSASAGMMIDVSLRTTLSPGSAQLDSNLTLVDPTGIAVAEAITGLNTNLTAITLQQNGDYTILVEPSSVLQTGGFYTGSYSLTMSDITELPAVTDTINFGQEVTGELTRPGQIDMYIFSASTEHLGKTTSIMAAGDAITAELEIMRPDGSRVLALQAGVNAGLDDLLLDQTGDYTISVSGNSANPVGRYRLGLSDLPIEATMTIDFEETLIGQIEPLADEDDYIFENTGTTIDIVVTTAPETTQQVDANLTLYDPNGVLIALMNTGKSPQITGFTLPSTGTYRIRVEPAGVTQGAYTILLRHTPALSATTVITFGQEVQGDLEATESADVYEFIVSASEADKPVSIVSIGDNVDTDLALYNPLGERVALFTAGSHSMIDDFILDQMGAWQIHISGGGTNTTGDYRLGLSDQPTETPEPLRSVSRSLNYVGDEDVFTFRRTTNPLEIKVTANNPTTMDLSLRVYDPNGRIVGQSIKFTALDGILYSNNGIIERLIPSQEGLYTLVVEPGVGMLANGIASGEYTLEVSDSGIAAVGTAGVEIAEGTRFTDSLSANAFNDYIIERTRGDFISAQVKNTGLKLRLSLYPPYGGASADSVLVEDEARSPSERIAFDDLPAPADGDYVVRVFNLSNSPGEIDISISRSRLTEATEVVSGATSMDSLLPTGDDDVYTFQGETGDVVQAGWIHVGAGAGFRGKIFDPNGIVLQKNNRRFGRLDSVGSGYEFTLPINGQYIAQVDTQENDRTEPGDATAEFQFLKRNIVTQAVIPGTSTTGTLDRIDQAIFTFEADANDLISIEVLPDLNIPTDMGPNRAALDPDIYLLSPMGETLASSLDRGNTRKCRVDDIILPQDGQYQLVVFPNGDLNGSNNPNSAGDFEIYFSDGPSEIATPITAGSTVEGDLDPYADDDFYSFNTLAGEMYQITETRQSTSLSEIDIKLFDPDMRLITTGINFSSVLDTRGRIMSFTAPSDGNYRIHLDDISGTSNRQTPSSYVLGLFKRNTKTAGISFGQTANDNLTPVDIHKYTFTGTKGDIVSFEAEPTSGDLNVDLELFSPFGTVLRTSGISFNTKTARLDDVVLPYSGQYEIWVYANGRENDAETMGGYILYVSDGPSEAMAALTEGVIVLESLATKGDDDFYTINATVGQTVKIQLFRQDQLNGKHLSLKAYNPNGLLLGESTSSTQDSGGGELTITFTMDGDFLVQVDSENVTETTDYSLIYNTVTTSKATSSKYE
jgi:hypothetical protein